MSQRRIWFVLLAFVAALAAPRLALALAASEGLFYETLLATEARERTRADESRREKENSALSYANMAQEMPALAPQQRRLDDAREVPETRVRAQAKILSDLESISFDQSECLAAPRAPPVMFPDDGGGARPTFEVSPAQRLVSCVYDAFAARGPPQALLA
ncbi:MAG: hypothetical protein KDB07_05270 [Planctomycetes bacterium]|nr:hypothetical protein [Planctomycetota bacterium]